MPYVPLNRIRTDLFTSGQEYLTVDTREDYVGPYYELYNGQKFSGKTPNDPTSVELIPYPSQEESTDIRVVRPVLPSDSFNADPILPEPVNAKSIYKYKLSKNIDLDQTYQKKLPEPYNPSPTPQDYQTGEFLRYFTKKINEYSFTEISKQTFESLVKRDSVYYWEFYIPTRMSWKLTGDESEVRKVNMNMVKLIETRFNMKGLSEYLKYDYLKFYRES